MVEPHTWSMNSSTGYGIAQFTPAGKIKAYADKVGKDVSDINTQLDFIWSQVVTTVVIMITVAAETTAAITIMVGIRHQLTRMPRKRHFNY